MMIRVAFMHVRPEDDYGKARKNLNDLFHDNPQGYLLRREEDSHCPSQDGKAPDLRAAFEKHKTETEGRVERLEQVFALIEAPAKGKTRDAINGLVEEGKDVIREFKGSPALDAGLLATAQGVEHYERPSRRGRMSSDWHQRSSFSTRP